MKKYTIWAFAAAISFAAVLSCAKEESINNFEDPENNLAGEQVTINASISPALTKVVFDPTYTADKPSSLSLTWKSSDKLRVADHANSSSYVDFDLTSGAGGQSAVFTGTAPVGATSYDVSIVNGDVAAGQAADGTTTHLQYLASKEDITDLTSVAFDTFNSILAITAKMPSDVAAVIKSVDITAYQSDGTTPANIFNAGNTLSITFGTIGDEGADNVLHFFATLPQGDQEVAAGTKLLVHFNAPGTAHTVYTRFIELGATTFTNSKLNTININAVNSASYANASSTDIGKSTNPYLVGDKYQMAKISGELSTTEKTYFKMVDDIALSSWSSIDCNSKGAIDLDGNNKTITGLNAPLFSFIDGKISNLSITGASISTNSNYMGSLVRTISKENCVISNVKVINGSVSGTAQVGGLIGRITAQACEVADCSSTASVTATANSAGGLIGLIAGGTINRCYSSGSVTAVGSCGGFVGVLSGSGAVEIASSYATGTFNPGGSGASGGFVGSIEGSNDSNFFIHDCYATGNLVTSNSYGSGGFVGKINKSSGTVLFSKCYATGNISTSYGYSRGGFAGRIEVSNVTIEQCVAWNGRVQGQTELNKWSAGAVVGVAHPLCTLTDNYRNPSMILHAYWGTSGQTKSLDSSYQHDNVSSTSALVTYDKDGNLTRTTKTALTEDGSSVFAYQGKCISGKTLSELTKSDGPLNWGSTYWDYEQTLPRLKWTLPTE